MKYIIIFSDKLVYTMIATIFLIAAILLYPILSIVRFCWDFKTVPYSELNDFIKDFKNGWTFKYRFSELFNNK